MTNSNTGKNLILKLIPVMLAFFAMGFVDSVGIATNYVKKDFCCRTKSPTFCRQWFFSGFWSAPFPPVC